MTRLPLMRSALVACALVATCVSAWSGPEARLQLSGDGPYYQLSLPLEWQVHSGRADLGDVRIQNIRGEALPYAWVELPDQVAVEKDARLSLFKWRGPGRLEGKKPSEVMRAAPSSPSWPIWVMDVRHVSGRLQQLQLNLPQGQAGIFSLAVEASPDLQSWTTVQDSVQLLHLQHKGQVLHQDIIELGGLSAAYVRLRLLPGSPEPVLGEATLRTNALAVATPPWSWSEPVRAVRCGTQYCDYAVPPQVLIGRIKVALQEPNTLLSLHVLGLPQEGRATMQGGVEAANTHPHGLRQRWRALRGKNNQPAADAGRAEADENAGWLSLGDAQVHWIDMAGQQLRSQEVGVEPGRFRMLRLSTADGSSDWTHRPPAMAVATRLRSLVFLARGAQPYKLSWASPQSAQMALPMAQLMPVAQHRDLGEMGRASLPVSPASQPEVGRIAPGGKAAEASEAVASSPAGSAAFGRIPSAWWLWAALLLGLGCMAYMVRAVLSPVARGEAAGQREA